MKFKEVSTEIVKLKVGEPVIGLFTGYSTRPWKDDDGVEKEITQAHMLEVDKDGKANTDKKFVIFVDAGLQNKMSTEGVKENQILRITRGEQTNLQGGKRVNNYKLEIAE